MKFLLKSGDFDSLIHKGKKETIKKKEQEQAAVDKTAKDRSSVISNQINKTIETGSILIQSQSPSMQFQNKFKKYKYKIKTINE